MECRDLCSIPGNDAIRRQLSDAIRSGALSHAYIIEGDAGGASLRRDLAFDAARAVLCTGDRNSALPCGICPSCRRADAGSHPDLRVIGRGSRATLGVDTIRSLKGDAYLIPSESERKVYIIEDADAMTVEAQNAFLLLLEEPPAYVLFLLLCRDSGVMLPTIRSRAPSLRLAPCSRAVIEEYLLSKSGVTAASMRSREPEKWAELLNSAAGDPKRALSLLDGKAMTELLTAKKEAGALLYSILSGKDDAILEIASMKKLRRDSALAMLSQMRGALRDMLFSKKSSAFETAFYLTPGDAKSASSPFSARKLALALDEVASAEAAVDGYAAVTTTLLSMAIKIGQQA